MPADIRTDILIIGGGVPGLTLSLLLGRVGIQIVLVDPAPLPLIKDIKEDGRTAALMQGSLNILRSIDVWQHCADISAPLQTLRIIDDKDRAHPEPLLVDFKADEIGMESFGYNIPITALRAHLAKAVTDNNAITFYQSALADLSFSDHEATATLEDGTAVSATLIVGADGRKSAVRSLSGIETWERDYGEYLNRVSPSVWPFYTGAYARQSIQPCLGGQDGCGAGLRCHEQARDYPRHSRS